MSAEQQVYIEDLDASSNDELIQLVGFKLGDEEYAIDVLKIQEIIRLIEITSVPRMDSYVLGVMNLRGKVIPVIDLRVRFNLDKSDFDKKTRTIVVKFEKENIGFVVDEVTEVARISKSMVEPTPPLVGSIGQEYILGICKYDDRLIILLDIDRVVYEGEKYSESDLRRRFMATDESGSNDFEMIESEVEEPEPEIAAPVIEAEQTVRESVADSIHDMVSDAIDDPVFETDEDAGPDLSDDIDALIAAELAMREQETEDLLEKKRTAADMMNDEDALDDILNDAINQSENVISPEADHVDQGDLDSLIAAELAMREQETEDLLQRKKEEDEKKKNDVIEEVEIDDPVAVAIEEIATEEVEQTKIVEDVEPNDDFVVKRDSIDELKKMAKKIIEGETVDLNSDIKSEIGELLKSIVGTKNRLDELDPNINDSQDKIPMVKETLEEVNEHTEKAAFNLMEAADRMSAFYVDINERFEKLERTIGNGDMSGAKKILNEVETGISNADNLGYRILQELEFQDITEQQLRKTINYVEDLGTRLGTIMGYVKLQQIVESNEDSDTSQDDIDQLLSEFGL